MLHADEFIKSVEFKYLLEFLKETFTDDQKIELTEQKLAFFFKTLGEKLDICETTPEDKLVFNEKHKWVTEVCAGIRIPTILSSGGYNNEFL